jgi:hypothetical protein
MRDFFLSVLYDLFIKHKVHQVQEEKETPSLKEICTY